MNGTTGPVPGDLFLVIDGHHLFHRTYNALPRSIVGNDGAPIQGVHGFIGAFLGLVRRFNPSHVAVPFDPPEPPFRRTLFPAYRTGRPRGTEEEVANFDAQVGQVQRVMAHLGVRYPMVPGYEADDAIGTLAGLASAAGVPTMIVSGDRDLLQLVRPDVTIFMPRGRDGETFTPEVVIARWGVPPAQFTALKALMGDDSDLIPGVPGIGPRTAAALLRSHGSLEGILAALPRIAPRQAASLAEHRERLALNHRLVTIVTTLDLEPDLDLYRWQADPAWTAGRLLADLGLRGGTGPVPQQFEFPDT
jgi:DNA polymerase-1